MKIILNGDIEGKLHYLMSEIDSDNDVEIPIGIIKAKFEKNCYRKLIECIYLHTECEVKDIELIESDGINFHTYEVTLILDEDEEEIRVYHLEIMPIF